MNIPFVLSESAKKVLLCKYPAEIVQKIAFEAAKNPDFGDYATNIAMTAAKTLGTNPMDLAAELAIELTLMPEVSSASIAKPGFVNIVLTDKFLLDAARRADEITQAAAPKKIDMDYASFNIAKSAHMGNLRALIVGDVLNRILRAAGHKTVAYNHLGDWGLPMGKVIAILMEKYPNGMPDALTADELNKFYPEASELSKADPDWNARAQKITALFQSGNPEYSKIYEWFRNITMKDAREIIEGMNVIPFDKWQGEKYASGFVSDVEKILRVKNLLEKDQGAEIVRIDENTPPLLFKTSHGTDTYAATDLGAIYYRSRDDKPDELLYITDFRQNLHFKQLFAVARRAGLSDAKLTHLGYGTVNGSDGKPFKTRDGGTPSIRGIVEMTVQAVQKRVQESGKDISAGDMRKIAVSALKFNDLAHGMMDNYVFEPAVLTSFEGRTGAGVLYTAVRLLAIQAKAGEDFSKCEFGDKIDGAGERALIMMLNDFDRTVSKAAETYQTELLANYAYDLAQAVNNYYHNYPILKSDDPHRKAVVAISLRVLTVAIDLLGMQIPSEM
ncbi:MAG: arginine--tRNA ligase [Rickettsiales bacterium]|jgi:arginyl-tRNA synthetase|nr:arginine--tRNA ligase [Rickettsiales bacterium]